MISRVLETIYWIGRYTERVENHARLFDACFHAYQESSGFAEDRAVLWEKLLETLGLYDEYSRKYAELDEEKVLYFLALDDSNPNSILNCLANSRNNTRAVRERVPAIMWEAINETYLWVSAQDISSILKLSPFLFFKRVRENINLFFGGADSAMLRQYEWHILQCGRYLERGENTARILRMSMNGFHDGKVCSEEMSFRNIETVLKTLDGLEGFRKFYAADVSVENVYRFILLNQDFPHSTLFPFLMCEQHLEAIKVQNGNANINIQGPKRVLKRIQGALMGLDDEMPHPQDVDVFLGGVIDFCNQLSSEINRTFFSQGELMA